MILKAHNLRREHDVQKPEYSCELFKSDIGWVLAMVPSIAACLNLIGLLGLIGTETFYKLRLGVLQFMKTADIGSDFSSYVKTPNAKKIHDINNLFNRLTT